MPALPVAVIDPGYARDLKMNVSPWATGASARAVGQSQAQINQYLPRWHEIVVPAFSGAFASGLQKRGAEVERFPSTAAAIDLTRYSSVVRSFLTAGFVFKTFTSSRYAPFVQVLLRLNAPTGAIIYHQLYVASDRPFNPLMKSLPARTPFLLEDIDSLINNPTGALDALRLLGEQLGQKFASDLLDNYVTFLLPHSSCQRVCSVMSNSSSSGRLFGGVAAEARRSTRR